MNNKPVIFRVDGNNSIGMGHVVRCLAVAEMLTDDFDCHFAIVNPDTEIEKIILKTCKQIIPLSNQNITNFTSILTGNEIVVMDGYRFTSADQQAVKTTGCKLVCIDDLHQQHFYADVVINHAITDKAKEYSAEPGTLILTGSAYIMLRKTFVEAAAINRIIDSFSRAFVCFGGADKEELCYKVCQLLPASVTQINVLLGAAYLGDLKKFETLAQSKNISIQTHRNIEPEEVLALMMQSDFAMVAASGIAYECAAAGLPMITGFSMDHQKEFYTALCQQTNITGVQSWQACDADKLNTTLQTLIKNYQPAAKSFVDGKQKERYLNLFSQLAA